MVIICLLGVIIFLIGLLVFRGNSKPEPPPSKRFVINASRASFQSSMSFSEKDIDKILKPIYRNIDSMSKKGYTQLKVDGSKWVMGNNEKYTAALNEIKDRGYKVRKNHFEECIIIYW